MGSIHRFQSWLDSNNICVLIPISVCVPVPVHVLSLSVSMSVFMVIFIMLIFSCSCSLGCSDIHFVHISVKVYPSLPSLGTVAVYRVACHLYYVTNGIHQYLLCALDIT
jgi:hypothetical protein